MKIPTTSGPPRSERLVSRLAEHEEAFALQAREQGMPLLQNRDVAAILLWTGEELAGKTPAEIEAAAWDVGVQAMFLAEQKARIDIRVRKINHEIGKLAWPLAADQPAYRWEDKVLGAILDHPLLQELHEVRLVAESYQLYWGRQAAALADVAKRLEQIQRRNQYANQS